MNRTSYGLHEGKFYATVELFDPHFNMQPVALQIAHGLGEVELPGLTEDEARHIWEQAIYTFPWYNGRERGMGIALRVTEKLVFIITWGEVRNTDQIFVDQWYADCSLLNPPTEWNFTAQAYKDRESFSCGEISKAVEYITGSMQVVLQRVVKEYQRQQAAKAEAVTKGKK